MTAVELAPDVVASVRDLGGSPPRCAKGPIRAAIEGALRPETTRRVTLSGWGPDSVLAALGLTKPEGGRSILAEEVKNEICDGATPYSTYVRGVVVDGDHGVLLTGSGDTAPIVEG